MQALPKAPNQANFSLSSSLKVSDKQWLIGHGLGIKRKEVYALKEVAVPREEVFKWNKSEQGETLH